MGLLVLTSCGSAKAPATDLDAVALIERDFGRYCESNASFSEVVAKLEADGWQKQSWPSRSGRAGQHTYLRPPEAPDGTTVDLVEIEATKEGFDCVVELLFGSEAISAGLARHLAQRPTATARSSRGNRGEQCQIVTTPRGEFRACRYDFRPHGISSSLEMTLGSALSTPSTNPTNPS